MQHKKRAKILLSRFRYLYLHLGTEFINSKKQNVMKQLHFPCILLLLLLFLAVSSCSDDEKEDFNGEGVPFVFSPEEANLPAEGGTMDFVFQNNNVKTCGYIYKINDYTFDPAFVYFARDDSYTRDSIGKTF